MRELDSAGWLSVSKIHSINGLKQKVLEIRHFYLKPSFKTWFKEKWEFFFPAPLDDSYYCSYRIAMKELKNKAPGVDLTVLEFYKFRTELMNQLKQEVNYNREKRLRKSK